MPSHSNAASGAAETMDSIYRYQRHIYDLSRKFYLFGRDRLLTSLPVTAGDRILEVGCGTGRNLLRLRRAAPNANLFGIDISREMLATASASLKKAGLADLVPLGCAGAANFDPCTHFGVDSFDTVYFSYVLSMIPDWRSAIDRALGLLKPGGTLAVVDFGDQAKAPLWRRFVLLNWLKLFHVHPRAEIEHGLREIALQQGGLFRDENILSGYSYLLMMTKRVN